MTATKNERVEALREALRSIEDNDELNVAIAIADYLDSTAVPNRCDELGRAFLAEVAMAYVEGYTHGAGERQREVWTALRTAGLSL